MKRKIDEESYRRRLARYEKKLERMRRRWPAIAQDAAHPLAAVLAARHPPWPWKMLAILVPLAVVASVSLFLLVKSLGVFALIGFIGIIQILFSSNKVRGRIGERVYDAFGGQGGKGYVLELWLAPLSYRQLAGIEIGRAYLRDCLESRIVAIVICVVASAIAILVSELTRFAPRWSADNLLLTGGIVALSFSIIPCSYDMALQGASARLVAILSRQHNRKKSIAGYVFRNLAFAMLIFIAVIFGAGFLTFLIVGMTRTIQYLNFIISYRHFGGLFIAIAAAIVVFSQLGLAGWTERRFAAQARRGEDLYKELAHMMAEDT